MLLGLTVRVDTPNCGESLRGTNPRPQCTFNTNTAYCGLVPVKSLGTTGTRHTSTGIGTIPNDAGVLYIAGIVGWHIPAALGDHHRAQ